LKTVLIIFFSFVASALLAQTQPHTWWEPNGPSSVQMPDPLNLSTADNRVTLGFEHTLSLYNWGSNVRLNFGNEYFEPSVLVIADGLSRLRQETDSRTSEANGIIQPSFPIIQGTTIAEAIIFGSVYNNDSKSSSAISSFANLSNVTDGYAIAGGRHIIDNVFTIQIDGGIALRNNNIGRSSGPMLLSRLDLASLPIDEDNSIESNIKIDERRFSYMDEVYRNDNVSAILRSNFGESGSNMFRAGTSLKRRDFFFNLDTNSIIKQERNELLFDITNEVRYPIVKDRLLSRLELLVAPSFIRRRSPGFDISDQDVSGSLYMTSLAPSNTSRSDFGITAALNLLPNTVNSTSALSSTMTISYRERSEDNTLETSELGNSSSQEIKNISELLNASSFASQETSALANASMPVSAKGTFFGELGARIYRYDTPSPDNLDDRDEQYAHVLLRYEHRFSSPFLATAGLRLSKNHLVYLKSERSAQNNAINSITFSTTAEYRSEQIINALYGEVFANYTQYDFYLPTASLTGTRDYVIRGMSIRDSIFIPFKLSSSLGSGIEARFDVRLSEQGSFNADAFTSRPQLGTQEVIAESLFHLVSGTASFPALTRVGIKALVISRRSNTAATLSASLSLQEQIIRTGPVLYLTLDKVLKSGTRLYGYCWYGLVSSQRSDGSRAEYTQVEGRIIAEVHF
jgi:hypothetical protein